MTAGWAAAFPIPVLVPLSVKKAEAEAMLAGGCRACLLTNLHKVAANLLACLLNLVSVWSIACGVHDVEGVSAALVHGKGLDLGTRDSQACLLEDASQRCQAAESVNRMDMHFETSGESALNGGLHHGCQFGRLGLVQLYIQKQA